MAEPMPTDARIFVAGHAGLVGGALAQGARTLARGLGLLTGAFGYVYVEYRRPAARATTSS